MLYNKQTYQGKFVPQNPEKYVGDVTNIIYRSGLELRFMKFCDLTPKVLEWASEEVVVPYVSPLDNKVHRYFVDFVLRIQNKNGEIRKYLVEVKPFKFAQEPTGSRKTKRFLNEVKQWAVNNAKWDAAKKFSKNLGWEFIIITEKDIGSM
jgi:hypothetical protein